MLPLPRSCLAHPNLATPRRRSDSARPASNPVTRHMAVAVVEGLLGVSGESGESGEQGEHQQVARVSTAEEPALALLVVPVQSRPRQSQRTEQPIPAHRRGLSPGRGQEAVLLTLVSCNSIDDADGALMRVVVSAALLAALNFFPSHPRKRASPFSANFAITSKASSGRASHSAWHSWSAAMRWKTAA